MADELKYTNLFIGALVIISCVLLVWTFGYTYEISTNLENIAIAQINI